jgi:hypothetical protein
MNHKLKILGIALAAVLATSATVTSTAQATPEYTCSAYPCTATGAGEATFTFEQGNVRCDVHYLLGKAGGGDLELSSSTATVTTTFAGCEAFGFVNTAIDKNKCDHLLHATERIGASSDYLHHHDIVCPAGSPGFVITAATCEVVIPPQNGLTTVRTANAGGAVTFLYSLMNITVNVTKDGFGCPLPKVGHAEVRYHSDALLSRVGGGDFQVSGE